MSQPYVGEIRMFGGNFAPAGWAFCSGQLVAISQNSTLFNLIGTTYGGDGQNTFALPNLQGRVPIHQGTSSFGSTYVIGQMAGTETVTLTTNQIPAHTHPIMATTDSGTTTDPTNNVLAANGQIKNFSPFPGASALNASALTLTGGSQPHSNIMPVLAVSFIISLFGIFPSQN